MRLIRVELLRILGRRGSLLGTAVAVLVLPLLVVLFGRQPDAAAWNAAIGFPLSIGAVVIGALTGSADTAGGTMRYLVLTGTPRWLLLLVRVPALIVAVLAAMAPGALLVTVAMLAGGQADLGWVLLGDALAGITWALVGMAVGTLLHSNGGAVALALAVQMLGYVAALPIAALVGAEAANALLPVTAVDIGTMRLGLEEFEVPATSLATSAWITLAWVAGLLALAYLRLARDEY